MSIRIPKWVASVGLDSARVVEAFRSLLGNVNLTRAELSRRMDMGPSTVGNWASGSKRPSLGSMKTTVAVLRAALADLQEQTAQMQELIDLVEAKVAASDLHRAEGTQDSLQANLAEGRRLTDVLDAMGVPTEPDR